MTGDLSERNKLVVTDMYDAAIGGDLDRLVSHIADEGFALHEPSFLPYGGTYHEKKGMIEAFGKIAQFLETSELRVDHVVADGEYVFGVLRAPDRATGELVLIAEENILRDGKVVEMRVFMHEAQSLTAKPVL